jgi:hypothetical protein
MEGLDVMGTRGKQVNFPLLFLEEEGRHSGGHVAPLLTSLRVDEVTLVFTQRCFPWRLPAAVSRRSTAVGQRAFCTPG